MITRISFSLFLLFLLSFGPGIRSRAQQAPSATDRPVRTEIPARSTDETYHIVPVDSMGVILYFRSVETVNDSLTKWYFSLYDETLHTQWVKSIPVRTGLEMKAYFLDHGTLTVLFMGQEKTKGISGIEMIVSLDCRLGKFIASRHLLDENAEPVNFVVAGNIAFVGYNLKNGTSHIQIIRPGSGGIADFPLNPQGSESNITGFIVDTVNNNIYVTIRKPAPKSHFVSELLKLNFSGAILSETEISTQSPLWEIRNPQIVQGDQDALFVIGTYAVSGRAVKNRIPTGSSGFFTCSFRNGVQTGTHLVNFLGLKSFQNIFGEKEMETIKKKAQKKNKSLNDYISEVNLLVHPVIVRKDEYLLLAESYKPEYHPENFTEFDFYGRPYINTYNVFDGYRYTSAIVAGFKRTGELKWDNSMAIRNLISTELLPKVTLYIASNDSMVLCYSSEARIASKIIHKDEVVEKLDFSALEQLNPEDKMISDTKNYMIPWYGPYFLCYGYQEIKNINSNENKKRLVYYFTKVRFE